MILEHTVYDNGSYEIHYVFKLFTHTFDLLTIIQIGINIGIIMNITKFTLHALELFENRGPLHVKGEIIFHY